MDPPGWDTRLSGREQGGGVIDWSYDAWPSVEANWGGSQPTSEWDRLDFHVDLGAGTVKKGRIGVDRYPARGVNVVMDLDAGRVFAMSPAPGRMAAEPHGNGWRYRTPGRSGLRGQPLEEHEAYLDYAAPPLLLPVGSGWQYARGVLEPWTLCCGLPFEDHSIESIITHHALEHVGEGFIPLMDDIYRVLKPGGILRVIVPLFPSHTAVADPDHCRYFMEGSFASFCGHLGSEDNPTGSWLDSFSVPYTKARFEMVDEDITPPVPPEDQWTEKDRREMRVALRAVK